jgi:hypothetical protein
LDQAPPAPYPEPINVVGEMIDIMRFLVLRRLALMIAALSIFGLAPGGAHAAAGDPTIVDNWANMDKCYRQSFEKFPDYTKEAELERQKFVRKCQVQYSIGTYRPLLLRH